ncbi:MAG: ribonuclease E/G, partial [Pelagibacteraceae bacterium]
EKKNKMTIDIITDNSLIIPEYIINIQNKLRKTIEVVEHFVKLKSLDQQSKNHELIKNYDAKKFTKKPQKKNFYKKTI